MNNFRFCTPLARNRLSLSGLLLGAMLLANPSQASDYYKWVDKKGVPHFSEQPLPGSGAKKVGSGSRNSDKSIDKTTAPDDTAEESQPQAATDKPAPKPVNDAACKDARSRLITLQSGQRIRLVGVDGKFSYLDENQIKAEITKTQDIIKNACP